MFRSSHVGLVHSKAFAGTPAGIETALDDKITAIERLVVERLGGDEFCNIVDGLGCRVRAKEKGDVACVGGWGQACALASGDLLLWPPPRASGTLAVMCERSNLARC